MILVLWFSLDDVTPYKKFAMEFSVSNDKDLHPNLNKYLPPQMMARPKIKIWKHLLKLQPRIDKLVMPSPSTADDVTP